MSESAGPDREASRLQAALDRIARAVDRRGESAGGDDRALAARLHAAEVRERRMREIASRLDALIEELRSSLNE
ncbi:MAG TPA: hypothetical protein VHY76_08370 [Acetobacteraceae bacterium]|jgi:hypothetical protein|nr:hypothetical protein [Acetobacteraceae bacterium]